MDGIFYGFAVLVFAAVILSVEGLWLWYTDNHGAAAKRIARRLRMMSDRERSGERISILKQRRYSKNDDFDALLHKMPLAHGIDKLLQQAGMKYSVGQFACATGLALFAGLALMHGSTMPLAARAVVVLALAGIPYFLLARARRKRLQKIEMQLPEVADFLARAMRAGHSFNNVLQMAGTDMPEPLAGEFRVAHEEINYGAPMHEALTSLAERVPLADMGYLVIAVLIQREAGGNLAEILGNISHIIRQRLKLVAQVRVLSAEGRMSAWILGLLPFGAGGAMLLNNLAYVSLLWTDPVGIRMSSYASVMLVLGIIWLRKLTKIRV